MLNSSTSLVVTIVWKAKYRFNMFIMLLLLILQNNYCNKSCVHFSKIWSSIQWH